MKKGKSNLKPEILLVALGGNALIRKAQVGSIEQQLQNLRVPISQIAKLAGKYRIIITHGNGPQVGNLLLQQECCRSTPQLPLEILVAQTQGQLGYMIESTLDSELMALGITAEQSFVSLISYVVVDENDPAFQNPTKPIGPFYPPAEAKMLSFPTRQTPQGCRRVVASPRPLSIVEKREIKKLIAMDFIVICCGGGGIPVIREGRAFQGVDAVIDKDLASATLAEEVGVHIFVIATDVPGVALWYGKPQEKFISRLTLEEASRRMKQGHFSTGSMEPKVEAAIDFVRRGGRKAVITSIENIAAAVEGKAGTEFVP